MTGLPRLTQREMAALSMDVVVVARLGLCASGRFGVEVFWAARWLH